MPLTHLSVRMSSSTPTLSAGELSIALAACVTVSFRAAASFRTSSALISESATRAKRSLMCGDCSMACSSGSPISRAKGVGGRAAWTVTGVALGSKGLG